MAGTLFVATLVIAATWLVLRRIERLERNVARAPAMASIVSPERDVHQPDFAWLSTEFSPPRHRALVLLALLPAVGMPAAGYPRTAVFIPVLLGAGLVVSLVAGLAERTAAKAYAGVTPATAVRRIVLGVVAAALVTGLAVAGIWWSAHYRPAALGAGVTELTVQVSGKTSPRPAEDTVEIVGRYCAGNAIAGVRVRHVEPVSPDTAILTVSPLLDEQAQRRYGGCLEDAILERHRLTVTEAVLVPQDDAP